MRITPYGEFSAFIAVAEQRNFTKAARQIGISTATLSQTIRALEERLGVRLLNRTTRSVSPTEAGETLLARLKPVLDDYEAAIDSVNQFRDTPAGIVRLTVAPPAAHSVITPRLREFAQLYPDIRLEISVDVANIDIVSSQFDAGIRRESAIDRDMIAVRVSGPVRGLVAAAPSYLAAHPAPRSPQDLGDHNCLRFRLAGGAIMPWRFTRDGENFEIPVNGSLIANDVELMVAAALDGIGLIYLTRDYVRPYLADGRLVAVLEDWTSIGDSLFLYYPSRRQVPAALRAVIDFLRSDGKARPERKKPAAAPPRMASRSP
ncbi:MAG TPA: LysR family transcriptional regulator [Stellaceae bacterium]|nr:LysR family transcriptional regulator [Stellaceae bacterium]